MKQIILVMALFFGFSASAAKMDAATELENYRQKIKNVNTYALIGYGASAVTRATGNCALSTALTFAAFSADTVPLANPIAEWLGNSANKNYDSYQVLWSWETLADTGRGALGGGVIAGYEFFEALVKYAAGEEITWEQLKKVYASTFAVSDAVFGQESRCIVNLAKVTMVRMEWRSRSGSPLYTPMTPIR